MTTVLVSGWKQGFEKVKFTQLLQTTLGYSLSRAKKTTDAVLESERVEFQVADDEANQILTAMEGLGAQCVAAVPTR